MATNKRTISMVLAIAVVCSFAIGHVRAQDKPSSQKSVDSNEQSEAHQVGEMTLASEDANNIFKAPGYASLRVQSHPLQSE